MSFLIVLFLSSLNLLSFDSLLPANQFTEIFNLACTLTHELHDMSSANVCQKARCYSECIKTQNDLIRGRIVRFNCLLNYVLHTAREYGQSRATDPLFYEDMLCLANLVKGCTDLCGSMKEGSYFSIEVGDERFLEDLVFDFNLRLLQEMHRKIENYINNSM